MMWDNIKDLMGIIAGLVGVCIGAWISPYTTAHFEKVRLKRTLKPDLIKALFLYYKFLKEKYEIVNPLSLEERGLVLLDEELKAHPSDSILNQKRTTLLDKIDRKYSQNDQITNNLTDAESAIHALIALIGAYHGTNTYNKCIDILGPFFKTIDVSPYLHDYINLTKDQYNNLAGDSLQKQIIQFGKQLGHERKQIIDPLVKEDF